MYQAIAHFRYQNFEQDPVTLISQVLNQWRLNGQVIGREMGITHHQFAQHSAFQVRLALPEQESLSPHWHSPMAKEALLQAEEAGVAFEYVEIIGRDYTAEESETARPACQILYTTHLDTCSPVYELETFHPIPLYRLPQFSPTPSAEQAVENAEKFAELNKQLIKWQEDWQACDQLQMNGGGLEAAALAQIADHDSALSQQGRALCQALERHTHTPTYYYLYRLGRDEAAEQNRRCPQCQQSWKLAEPLHGIFHFQCHACRLISNYSWELL